MKWKAIYLVEDQVLMVTIVSRYCLADQKIKFN